MLISWMILLVCLSLDAQDNPGLRFGENVKLISLEGESVRYPALSMNGDYLYANMYLDDYINGTVFPLETNQAIWELNWTEDRTELLTYQNLDGDNTVFAIFVNNQIAIRTSTEIQLRTIEDFSITDRVEITAPFMPEQLAFPNQYYNYLIKSIAGTELATFDDERFWVWDIDTQETYSVRLSSDIRRTETVSTEIGWIMRFLFDGTVPAFMFCTPHLEECNYGERPYHSALATSPDGRRIFSGYVGETMIESYAVWFRQDDGEYEIQIEYLPDEYPLNQGSGLCRLQINSSSTYISSLCGNKRLEIWDINLTALQHRVDDVMMRRWLPDGEHFITLSFSSLKLSLYEVGNDTPLDEFLVSDFSEAEGILPAFNIDETLLVSERGNVVLLNQGSVALMIPIIDENSGE